MRAVWAVVALVLAGSGCIAFDGSYEAEARAWFTMEGGHLSIAAPWVAGDQVLAIHLEAAATGTCAGTIVHGSDGKRAVASVVVDTIGIAGAASDTAIASAHVLGNGAGLYFGTPGLVGWSVDEGSFQGNRTLWLIAPGVRADDLVGGLMVDLQCTGAVVAGLQAGHAMATSHWHEGSDAAVMALDTGAQVAAAQAASLSVAPGEQGILLVVAEGVGATVVDGPDGPAVHDPGDGPFYEELGEGTFTVRSATYGRPTLAALASAHPVDDWAQWFGAPQEASAGRSAPA